jgi:hypothetical protein
VLGTNDGKETGVTGGSSTHTHKGVTGHFVVAQGTRNVQSYVGPPSDDGLLAGANHSHYLNPDAADNIPPFTKLIYIMKL